MIYEKIRTKFTRVQTKETSYVVFEIIVELFLKELTNYGSRSPAAFYQISLNEMISLLTQSYTNMMKCFTLPERQSACTIAIVFDC